MPDMSGPYLAGGTRHVAAVLGNLMDRGGLHVSGPDLSTVILALSYHGRRDHGPDGEASAQLLVNLAIEHGIQLYS